MIASCKGGGSDCDSNLGTENDQREKKEGVASRRKLKVRPLGGPVTGNARRVSDESCCQKEHDGVDLGCKQGSPARDIAL